MSNSYSAEHPLPFAMDVCQHHGVPLRSLTLVNRAAGVQAVISAQGVTLRHGTQVCDVLDVPSAASVRAALDAVALGRTHLLLDEPQGEAMYVADMVWMVEENLGEGVEVQAGFAHPAEPGRTMVLQPRGEVVAFEVFESGTLVVEGTGVPIGLRRLLRF